MIFEKELLEELIKRCEVIDTIDDEELKKVESFFYALWRGLDEEKEQRNRGFSIEKHLNNLRKLK